MNKDIVEKYDYSNINSAKIKAKLARARVSTISFGKAVEYFDDMKETFGRLFRYREAGCDLRTHLMCGYLFEHGVRPKKAWIYSNQFYGGPQFLNPIGTDIQWRFHVAPAVDIRFEKHGPKSTVILDPTMLDGPASIDEWETYSSVKELGRSAYIGIFESSYSVGTFMNQLTASRVREDFMEISAKAAKCPPSAPLYKSSLRAEFEAKAEKITSLEEPSTKKAQPLSARPFA